MTPAPGRPIVLCVDDEPQVLEGLMLHLRRLYDVRTAISGPNALAVLADERRVIVILSDMRMPGMDGAAFLARSRAIVPEATRVLLTGHTDVTSAIAAINDGQVFRFLTKPCLPTTLLATMTAAVEQHRLVTAEKVLLEETLHGCLKALSDVLALANPTSFGRALRVRHQVTDVAAHLGLPDAWEIEIAAMFSQLGMITLPHDTAERVLAGEDLSEEERTMVRRMPSVTERLLANIPRLESIRAILTSVHGTFRPIEPGADLRDAAVRRGAHLLRAALDFDELETRGMTASEAIGTMRGRVGVYDPAMVDAIEACRSSKAQRTEVREVRLMALRPGMVFAEDVRSTNGTLLVARGYEITERFVARLGNVATGSVKEPLKVILPRG